MEVAVEPISARTLINAATATTADGAFPRSERRRRLSPAALAVVNQKVRAAYSMVVIAGLVRLTDFVSILCVGLALYLAYVARLDGFE